jgi:surfeit locus 1 family protein
MVQHIREYSTQMQFGGLEFRFRWMPTLLFALPIPLFIGLGMWQLDRADQKREQARELSERMQMPALELGARVSDPQDLRYRRLRAHGAFEAGGQLLIENRRQGNRNGFHVITPLRIAGSDMRVLVNRGWIPAAADGSATPAPVPDGPVTVTGESHIPSPPALVLHGGPDAAKQWGTRWPYLTVDLYAAVAGHPVLPVVILQDPDTPGGFLRSWPREMPKEGMHIGYAIQWFAFAVIALVLWLRLSLVRRPETGISL